MFYFFIGYHKIKGSHKPFACNTCDFSTTHTIRIKSHVENCRTDKGKETSSVAKSLESSINKSHDETSLMTSTSTPTKKQTRRSKADTDSIDGNKESPMTKVRLKEEEKCSVKTELNQSKVSDSTFEDVKVKDKKSRRSNKKAQEKNVDTKDEKDSDDSVMESVIIDDINDFDDELFVVRIQDSSAAKPLTHIEKSMSTESVNADLNTSNEIKTDATAGRMPIYKLFF